MLDPIQYVEHASDVIAEAVRLIDAGDRFVLITAIDIQGGSSRELGTLALIKESGEMVGYLSNGCIDRDIQAQGVDVLQQQTARVLHYGVGSPFLDLTLPCGGALKLLLDPAPDHQQVRDAQERFVNREPATLRFVAPDAAPVAFTYMPKPRLILAGRGSVFRAMAEVGAATGFEIEVLSPEEEDLKALAQVSPRASAHLTTPDDAPDLDLDTYSGFLTLFHDHDWEPALLLKALQTEARFIGSLGSQRTHAMRCDRLRAMGVNAKDLDRIHGPIGLVPSLRHAPFIAISAMAHVIEVFPKFIEQEGLV